MEYLLAGAVVVLIVALIGLVASRNGEKELKEQLNREIEINEERLEELRELRKDERCIETLSELVNSLEEDKKALRKSNSANQGWNVKYRKTIEDLRSNLEGAEYRAVSNESSVVSLEGELEKLTKKSVDMLEEQADTIQKLNCSLDESYIAINAVGNEPKKKTRLELLDKYMNK